MIATKRNTADGLVALLDSGLLTMEQLTDAELELITDPAWQPVMRQLSEQELDAIINGEQAAIHRFVELAERAGLAWQG